MIELSKCPQCAPNDRATIAGMEFCMRCGTPAEDNQAMSNPQAGGSAIQPSVAKFSATPPPVLPDITSVPAPAITALPSIIAAPAPAIPPTAPLEPVNIVPNAPIPQVPATNPPTAVEPIAPVALPQPEPVLSTALPQPEPVLSTALPQPEPAGTTATTASSPQAAAADLPLANVQPTNQPLAMQEPAGQALAAADIYLQSADTRQLPPPVSNVPNGLASPGNLNIDSQPGVLSDAQFASLGHALAPNNPVDSQPAPNDTLPLNPATPPAPVPVVQAVVSDITPLAAPVPERTAVPARISNDIYASPTASLATAVETQEPATEKPKAMPSSGSSIRKILKPAGVAVSILVLFMTGAYIWKVNYPSLAFKIASAKAGIAATIPGYIPSGYNLGSDIQANPGSVSYYLQNKQDAKKISISQSKTNWDSQALAEDYVAPKAENYLALQAQGLTIYVLGSNQATWVNHGTWYKIDSPDQALDQDQIIKIATSL